MLRKARQCNTQFLDAVIAGGHQARTRSHASGGADEKHDDDLVASSLGRVRAA
jgi:uncharacterized phage protein gp47/JayE